MYIKYKIIIPILLILIVGGVMAIDLTDIGDTSFYLKDGEDNLIITEKGERCVSYVNITTTREVYEKINVPELGMGIVEGDFLGYEDRNITTEVWFPCKYKNDRGLSDFLERKRQKIIDKEISKIEEKQSLVGLALKTFGGVIK